MEQQELQEQYGRICVDCMAGLASSGGDDICTACLPGFFAESSRADKCEPCGQGRFANTTHATQCTQFSVSSCDAGLALSPAGNATHDASCAECAPGRFQPDWSSTSTSCTRWTYTPPYACDNWHGTFFVPGNSTVDSECTNWTTTTCPIGSGLQQPPNSTADGLCSACADGFFQPNVTSQLPCQRWTYASNRQCQPPQAEGETWKVFEEGNATADSTCFFCPAGRVIFDDPPSCPTCAAGQFAPAGNETNVYFECQECSSGFFSDREAGQCDPWTYASCDQVEGTFFVPGNTTADSNCKDWTVTSCSAGSGLRAPNATADGACDSCEYGFFQSKDTSGSPCQRWKYLTFTECQPPQSEGETWKVFEEGNATADSKCFFCPAGRVIFDDPPSCPTCAAGQFAPAGNETNVFFECQECSSGFFSDREAGQCDPWTYASCDQVEGTFFVPGNTTADSNCKDWTVTSCSAGSGLRAPNATSDGACESCEYGFYQPANDSSAPCKRWTNATQWDCALGQDMPVAAFEAGDSTSDSRCYLCSGGWYLDQETARCYPCGSGQYAPASNWTFAPSKCSVCPNGTFSGPEAQTCTQAYVLGV